MMQVITLFFTLYFIWHAWHGKFGIKAHMRQEMKITLLQKQLMMLQQESMLLENRISLMRADNLDHDMLTERARDVLWVMRKDEVIIED